MVRFWICLNPTNNPLKMLRRARASRSFSPIFRRYASGQEGSLGSSHNTPLNELDKKWKKRWNEVFPNGSIHSRLNDSSRSENNGKDSFYCLTMFPYPSGNLHMGHQRVYTISDVIARFKKLKGYNVIHPMGWDAFGLPAENAAVERGADPADWTEQNVEQMKKQFDLMLVDFDWEREINTSSPDYYKWTQKLFTLLFEKGLAYRAGAVINWDPVDQTVLANEQVDSEGRSWRSGALVEKRELEQWFIGITKYAEELLNDLTLLEGWPEKVKAMQKNWIGLSKGADIDFPVSSEQFSNIRVYTSRPDTLFSVQFLALSLEHPIVTELARSNPELAQFIDLHSESDIHSTLKDGFELKGIRASIPLTVDGTTNETFDVPIFAAPYVIGGYGSGTVMGCPAHDSRDNAFWSQHRPGQAVKPTIRPLSGETAPEDLITETGIVSDNLNLPNGLLHLGKFNGLTSAEAGSLVCESLSKAQRGGTSTQLRIRDWLISRQRYWGAPIPIIHCDSCGAVPVPDKDLPVLLPKVSTKNFGKGNPLGSIESFVNTKCPSCGGDARRETDTMDTFIDSSWYFFRFCDPHNSEAIFDYEKASRTMPVDLYTGGVEHAILHLLYSRFISKFLGDAGLWNGKNFNNEPIKRLVTQGMVHGKTYKDPENGKFLKPDEITLSASGVPMAKNSGKEALVSYEKMSKSKYNGVDPAACIKKYGADAVRAHTLFSAPISDVLLWNEELILGIERWLKKVLKMSSEVVMASQTSKSTIKASETSGIILNGEHYELSLLSPKELQIYNATEEFTAKISQSIDVDLSLNTIVLDYMKLTNLLQSAFKERVLHEIILDSYKKLLICMAPVVPAIAEECWEILLRGTNQTWSSIFSQKFPDSKPALLNIVSYNVIINGKRVCAISSDEKLIGLPEQEILSLVVENLPPKKNIDTNRISKMVVKKGVISLVCK